MNRVNANAQCVNRQTCIPLELIHLDVWGPALASSEGYMYYVSFIDDYSKFSWIYLLKKRSEVFQVFQNFQALVERKFDRKILAVQSDWGGEYEKLNSFFLSNFSTKEKDACPKRSCHRVDDNLMAP
mgnify:CR=1 FL=1